MPTPDAPGTGEPVAREPGADALGDGNAIEHGGQRGSVGFAKQGEIERDAAGVVVLEAVRLRA
jgi:hypothetical protein